MRHTKAAVIATFAAALIIVGAIRSIDGARQLHRRARRDIASIQGFTA
jgi:hypothetical protein